MWSVNRGKAFLTVPDTTVSLKVEVLTLSGLQQIEINRFDAATRGVVWEEHPPSRDQKKVVNQYLKYLSKMWENDKAEGPNMNPPPSVYSRDPRRQTGQHHQNLVANKVNEYPAYLCPSTFKHILSAWPTNRLSTYPHSHCSAHSCTHPSGANYWAPAPSFLSDGH